MESIQAINDAESRSRCLRAYEFLMAHEQSAYAKFVNLRQTSIADSKKFNVYDFTQNVGVECALWPNLYPDLSFCETFLNGQQNRTSTKIAFMTKVFSEIADYGTSFELLQFPYDIWLFKTVSGAITTARKRSCSPATSHCRLKHLVPNSGSGNFVVL